jgi:hypothetical protein
MTYFVSAQMPAGFFPPPFSYYHSAAFSTQNNGKAVADSINSYHDYPPLVTHGSQVVLLTKCLKELNG